MQVNKIIFTTLLFLISLGSAQATCAQSTNQALPTPILANDIAGKISALDLGDPRATRHFYAFAASPGDLLITVESRNLNGDIDVFTAITFRPLMKATVLTSSRSASVTKSIYLRAHQILILRVEARTPSDEPGTYHIHFGGSFEPFSGGIPVAENTENTESSTERTASNRLSSVGATIPRPPAETAEAKPSPSPETTVEKSEEKPAGVTGAPKTTTTKPAATTTARRTITRPLRRGVRPAPAKTPPPPAEKKTEPITPAEPAVTEPKAESKPEESAEKTKPSVTTPPTEKPKTQDLSSQTPGSHLIIEQKDGTRIERPMSTVRRVLVEGPTIVVVLKTGRIDRFAMRDVVRVAIEPQ